MRRFLIAAAALVTLSASSHAQQQTSGCSFDLDCNIGSKCLKKQGQLYGVCVGGLQPGRPVPYEERNAPQSTPPRPLRDGEQCSFNLDCQIGSTCLKSSGALYGVCFKP